MENIKLIGFNITKIEAEKKENTVETIDINSNIKLLSIEKHKLEISKQESLKIRFEFEIVYKDLGKVFLTGTMFLLVDNKTLKDALKSWENKKLPENLNLTLLNIIMQRSSLKALQLEEELGLPFHFQLPRLQQKPSD